MSELMLKGKKEQDSIAAAKTKNREVTPMLGKRPLMRETAVDFDNITPSQIAHLQRTVGNQAIRRAVQRMGIQRKMTLGPVGDKYEQEADAVAKQVVQNINAPKPQPIQRQEDDDELQMQPISTLQRQEEEEEEVLQAKPSSMMGGSEISADIENSIQSAKGGGRPLAGNIESSMGQAFNADFSGVNIHTNGQADTLNRSLQARAFTTGQDIFFRSGEYSPNSSGGQELLAHELTHVVQQNNMHSHTHRKVQRVLDKDMPIVAQDIASITNPHGNVYILTGHNEDKIVVKFEVPGGEGKNKYQAGYDLGEELGQKILDGAIIKNQLTDNDINQLKAIPNNQDDGRVALLDVLNKGLAEVAVGIKMDSLSLGRDLFDMKRNNNDGQYDQPLSRVLDNHKCKRYGQMAFYDLLTRNYDRFLPEGGIVNNLDFDENYDEAVPLDNIYFSTTLVNNNWQSQLDEMDNINKKNRLNYAAAALGDIRDASGITIDQLEFELKIIEFKKGMNDAEARAKNTISQWRRVLRFGGGSRNAGLVDKQEAQKVLIARYERSAGL